MTDTMAVVNVKIPVEHREQMNSLARENDRTFAAEVRIAIRTYLQSNGPSAPLTEADARAATKGRVTK